MLTLIPMLPDFKLATVKARFTKFSEMSPDFFMCPAKNLHVFDLELGTPLPAITTSAPIAPASIILCNALYPIGLNLLGPNLSNEDAILSATDLGSKLASCISATSIWGFSIPYLFFKTEVNSDKLAP